MWIFVDMRRYFQRNLDCTLRLNLDPELLTILKPMRSSGSVKRSLCYINYIYCNFLSDWTSRNSLRGVEAYQKLVKLNSLDIRFYIEAKRIGEAMLEKHRVNISDPKCMQATYFLPKQIEHLRGRISSVLRESLKEKAANQGLNTHDFGNNTAKAELLCLPRVFNRKIVPISKYAG